MELMIKRYEDLTRDELYEILRIRVSVFVVEQACPYQEIDGRDPYSYHVFLRDADGIQAYLRVIPSPLHPNEASIGRVLTLKRKCGLGGKILAAGIQVARERLCAATILIEAQTYAKSLYENAGFQQISEEFLEDGIPHISMRLRLDD